MRDLPISRRDVQDALRFARSVSSRASGGGDKGITGTLIRQGTSGAAAFGYGVLEGRFGPLQVGPVPANLVAAILLNFAGFSGFAGGAASHVHDAAQGLLDGYLHTMGVSIGDKLSKSAPAAPPQVKAAGARRSIMGASPMTQAEIATMGQAHFAGRYR